MHKNCCMTHWRGSAHSFPRGEAVAQIGTSEPIWVTDEERRYGTFLYAVRKEGTTFKGCTFLFTCAPFQKVSPFLIRPCGAPSPRGKVFAREISICQFVQNPIHTLTKTSHGKSHGRFVIIQDSSSLSSASSEPEAWLNRFSSCSTVSFFFSSPLTSTTILPSYIITRRLP